MLLPGQGGVRLGPERKRAGAPPPGQRPSISSAWEEREKEDGDWAALGGGVYQQLLDLNVNPIPDGEISPGPWSSSHSPAPHFGSVGWGGVFQGPGDQETSQSQPRSSIPATPNSVTPFLPSCSAGNTPPCPIPFANSPHALPSLQSGNTRLASPRLGHWEDATAMPHSHSGTCKEVPHYRVERLEAEDDADWWRRAASAAASMSTSLRERGTFSALRSRLSSSRPFRLSDRPNRTSALELEEGGGSGFGITRHPPLSPQRHRFPDRQVGKAARETQSWWS